MSEQMRGAILVGLFLAFVGFCVPQVISKAQTRKGQAVERAERERRFQVSLAEAKIRRLKDEVDASTRPGARVEAEENLRAAVAELRELESGDE